MPTSLDPVGAGELLQPLPAKHCNAQPLLGWPCSTQLFILYSVVGAQLREKWQQKGVLWGLTGVILTPLRSPVVYVYRKRASILTSERITLPSMPRTETT
jgi:hypothetical protein